MNVIINFITKNKEIFIFILLILSVLILFKYNLKEGHTSDTSDCDYDYTNEILEVMTKYLDINNKSWSKLIEINNKYVEFQDKMKVYGITASHEKTCGNGEAVLPIDVAEKYMKDAGDLLIGDGGMYELFVEHTKLFDQLKEYKQYRRYRTNVIVDSNEYNSNICDDNGFCQRAAWGNIEGSYDSNNDFVPRVTFDLKEKIGDPEENNGDNNYIYIKTYVYQVCSVAEYIVGEIWKHCADSICIQMTTECDNRINNLTNKWTFDKTKICRGSVNSKCPGAENAFMSYIGYPNPGLDTGIYLDPSISAPTLDCPQATTKVALRDCYWGKVSNDNAYQKNGDNIHYTKEYNLFKTIERDIANMPGQIEEQKLLNIEAEKAATEEFERQIAELSAPVIINNSTGTEESTNCLSYVTQLDSSYSRQEAEAQAVTLCKDVGCNFEIKKPNGNNAVQKKNNGNWSIECQE